MTDEEIAIALGKAIFLDTDEAKPLFDTVLANLKAHESVETLKEAIASIGVPATGISAYAFKADKFLHTLDQGMELYQHITQTFPKCLCKTHISQAHQSVLLIILGENQVGAYIQVSANRAVAKALKLPFEVTVSLNGVSMPKSPDTMPTDLNSKGGDSYADETPSILKIN